MSKEDEARKRRAQLVKELDLSGRFKRYHTPTGEHRKLPDGPPEVDPEVETSGIRRRRANLKKRTKGHPRRDGA